ncbi:MAG TPA: hypothetical protein VN642_20020 [Dongiaceae bacterium]|nr:hypothetical protein [Dongiaceae bacterium]
MQKYVPYILGLLLVACIAGCGSGGTTTSAPPVYAAPKSFASYSSLPDTPRGGAVQWGAISTSAKSFSNYSVSTVTGIAGSSGFTDGPPALFNHPTDITFDANGKNFYVTDYLNNAIRKITSGGVVTTLQCTDLATGAVVVFNRPNGITTDGKNLYVVDTGSNTVRVIEIATNIATRIGSAIGLAGSIDSTDRTAVLFNQPIGITTDGKNLYVTDFNNATVRWIDINNNYAVSTLAGAPGVSGSTDGKPEDARFHLPGRITTDGKNLYLTDFYSRTIRQIDIRTGTVTTIAGSPGPESSDYGTADGTGSAAHFNQPNGITTDGINLYVTDTYLNSIRKIVISSGDVTTIAGIPAKNGIGGNVDSPGTPSFYSPIGITTDGTSLFVADSYNNTIRKIR